MATLWKIMGILMKNKRKKEAITEWPPPPPSLTQLKVPVSKALNPVEQLSGHAIRRFLPCSSHFGVVSRTALTGVVLS